MFPLQRKFLIEQKFSPVCVLTYVAKAQYGTMWHNSGVQKECALIPYFYLEDRYNVTLREYPSENPAHFLRVLSSHLREYLSYIESSSVPAQFLV